MSKRIAFIFLLVLTNQLSQATNPGDKWDVLVTISTSYGDMQVILFDETPKHKANFIKLINQGFYDSLLFHRVMKDFMIQGGDPDSRIAASGAALGRGGPGYTVPAEIRSQFFHRKGALAAARQPDRVNPHKASSGSQFFLVQGDSVSEESLSPLNREVLRDCLRKIRPNTPLADSLAPAYAQGQDAFEAKLVDLADEIYKETGYRLRVPQERIAEYTKNGGIPYLDDQYTIFGQVIVGLEIIDKIAEVKVDARNRPDDDIRMSITAIRMKKKKITKLYGYVYEE